MNCSLCGEEDHYTDECEYGLGEYGEESDAYAADDVEIIEAQADAPQEELIPAESLPSGYQSKLGIAQDIMTLAQSASSGDAATISRALEQFSKSQLVRFLDVSFIGPFLLLLAYRGKITAGERFVLGLIGAGTVIYNGRNYLANKKIVQPEAVQAIQAELQQAKLAGYR